MNTFTDRILARVQTLASKHDCAILRADNRSTPQETSPMRSIAAEDIDAIFPSKLPATPWAPPSRNNQLLKAYLESCRYGVRTLIDRDGIHWHIAINQPRDPDFLLTIARLGEYFRAPCIACLPQSVRPYTLCTDPGNPRFGHAKPLRKSLATGFRRAGGSGELCEWRESATEIAQQNGAPGKMAVHAICRAIGRELTGMTIRIAPQAHDEEEISFDYSKFSKK